MMRNGEVGQALIWVLIILTVGVLILVPGLGLVYSGLKASQIATRNVQSLYLAEAAQEYVLWKLSYTNFGDTLSAGVPIDVQIPLICGDSANVSVVLQAAESQGPVTFATEHVIKPTLTVIPAEFNNNDPINVTYVLKLEQLSDNTTQGLDAIYHMLPKEFDWEDYEEDSSYIRYGNGPWEWIADPIVAESSGGVELLQWPATYDYAAGTGGFTSPFRDFQVREVKYLKFDVSGGLPKTSLNPSWVVLKPWDTLSGSAGIITVGNPDPLNGMQGGGIQAYSTTSPTFVEPPVINEPVDHTIYMTNFEDDAEHIKEIRYWLPIGFTYSDNSTSGIIDTDPDVTMEYVAEGQTRERLTWVVPGAGQLIAIGETMTLDLSTSATIVDSGTYFSEIVVLPAGTNVPTVLRDIGIDEDEYAANYSWNTGGITVPHYDAQATAGEVVIDSSIGWGSGVLQILSWNLE